MTEHVFQVTAIDLFHGYDEEADNYRVGTYSTYEEARRAAESFVERSVREHARATAAETVSYWFTFGEGAIVSPDPDEGITPFHDADHAREVAARIESEASPR